MARKKKDGKRATGIQSKSGRLYILKDKYVVQNGVKVRKREWIDTGLDDVPENIRKASELRERYLSKSGALMMDRNITISELVDLKLAQSKREHADTTYSSYSYRGKHIKQFFGDTKVRNIDKFMVENFLDELFLTCELQPRSVDDIKVFLGSVINLAVEEGIIFGNPARQAKISQKLSREYAREESEDDEFFSYEESVIFLGRIEDHELYEYYYVTLFFGLRREEALGLKWSAVNLKKKTLTICHTVTVGTKVNRNNATKTEASHRIYPLTDEQVELFLHIKKKEERYRKLFGKAYFDSDYIFKHEDGTLFYPDYPSKKFREIISMNPDLPQQISLRGLRSSCVSMLVHDNYDPKSVQKWVGHADYNTTLKIYAKVKEKESKIAISEHMSGLIKPKKYKD